MLAHCCLQFQCTLHCLQFQGTLLFAVSMHIALFAVSRHIVVCSFNGHCCLQFQCIVCNFKAHCLQFQCISHLARQIHTYFNKYKNSKETDVEFVKSFAPVGFPNFSILPEKMRKARHFWPNIENGVGSGRF